MAIARALVNRPALLLDLNASGQTLILVTHNPDLAARYARRVIQLVDGTVAGDAVTGARR